MKKVTFILFIVLLVSLTLSACAQEPAEEEGPTPVEFRLNWTLYGEHAPFFVGR